MKTRFGVLLFVSVSSLFASQAYATEGGAQGLELRIGMHAQHLLGQVTLPIPLQQPLVVVQTPELELQSLLQGLANGHYLDMNFNHNYATITFFDSRAAENLTRELRIRGIAYYFITNHSQHSYIVQIQNINDTEKLIEKLKKEIKQPKQQSKL